MDLQLVLENKLLKIRLLENGDLEPLYDVAKDPMIWEQHPCKRYLRSEFAKFFIESIESKGALVVFDKTTGKIIGSSRFKKVAGFKEGVEIGWTFLSRKYWGGEYNKMVKDLMIEYAFRFVDNIIFYVDKDNIRSQKAVQKIGGRKITDTEYEKLPQTSPDNITFIINKHERK